MYTGVTGVASAGVATTGALAFTGINILWLLLAAFALISAGLAALRVLPKREG